MSRKGTIAVQDVDGIPPLSRAAYYGHVEVVRLLLHESQNPSADISAVDRDGFTALHWAAYSNQVEIIQLILGRGGLTEVVSAALETPLHVATERNSYDAVVALLNHGANIDAVRRDGWTPLLIACHKQYADLAKMLLERGANVDVTYERGREDEESLRPPKKYSPWKRGTVLDVAFASIKRKDT